MNDTNCVSTYLILFLARANEQNGDDSLKDPQPFISCILICILTTLLVFHYTRSSLKFNFLPPLLLKVLQNIYSLLLKCIFMK